MTQLEDDLAELSRTLPGLAGELTSLSGHVATLKEALEEATEALTTQDLRIGYLVRIVGDRTAELSHGAHASVGITLRI